MESRKLSVILFTDMVGYSAKVQANEDQALALLQEHNVILQKHIDSYKGRTIKTIGDAFLADFESVLNAVNCAVSIRKELNDRNATVPENRKIEVRIGIHVGDVIYRDQDVFGDGVNIASRIQSIARAGRILISHDIYSIALGKLSYQFYDHGVQPLKNIARPIHIYEVLWQEGQDPEKPAVARRPLHNRVFALGLAAAAAILVLWLVPMNQRSSGTAQRPTLAILAFADQTGDERMAKIHVGRILTDAVTQKFYEFPQIQLISPLRIARTIKDASLNEDEIAGNTAAAEKVARELNCRLMLSGHLQKLGSTFILSADLNDLDEEKLVASYSVKAESDESILGPLVDSLSLKFQMKIRESYGKTEQVITQVPPISELTTSSLEAYSHLVEGWRLASTGYHKEGVRELIRATEIDTEFALAYSLTACTASFDKNDSIAELYTAKAMRFKDRFNGISKEALIFRGNLAWAENKADEAEKNYRLITELYPDDRDGYVYLGDCLFFLKKDYQQAYDILMRAHALSPDYWPITRDLAYIVKQIRNVDEAVMLLTKFITDYPDNPGVDAARRQIAELRGQGPTIFPIAQ